LLLPVVAQHGGSWQYTDYVEYPGVSPPTRDVTHQARQMSAGPARTGPATPPSEARILELAQTLPPKLRPPPPPQISLVNDRQEVIHMQIVADAKARYGKMMDAHLDAMDEEYDRETCALDDYALAVKKEINERVDDSVKYKEEQLEYEFNKSMAALREQARKQQEELKARAQQMIENRNALIDGKLREAVQLIDGVTAKQASLIRGVASKHETTFDEAVGLLARYQQDLRQSQEEFEQRTRQLTHGAEQRLKHHAATSMSLFS